MSRTYYNWGKREKDDFRLIIFDAVTLLFGHLTPTDAVCRLLRYSIEFLGSALHCLTTVYKSCWFISHMSYSTHLSSFTFRLFIFIMSSRKGQFYIYTFHFAFVYFLNTFIVYYFVFFVDHVVQNNFINEHYWNYLLKII